MLTLTAEIRTQKGRALKSLRAEGKMPAVVYGAKEQSSAISIPQRDFVNIWKEAGESSVISLSGLGEDKEVLIHDIDVDPVSGIPRHADFYAIEKGKKVQVKVPLIFDGVAPAIKELGGTLVKVLHEVEIEAMPKDLPQDLAVDISKLNDFSSQVLAGDVKVPEGVALLTEKQEVVALVEELREEELEEVSEAPDLSQIEVEGKGKEEGAKEAEGEEAAPQEEKNPPAGGGGA